VQAAEGDDLPDMLESGAVAVYYDVYAHTIHTYILGRDGHLCAAGRKRRYRGGLSFRHQELAKTMLSVRDHDSVTLESLSQACGLSPSHFARAFKQSVGMPPHQWALKNKISIAKRMLLQGDHSLPTIAFACGFVDQSHLGRWFKRLTGISPSAWQRRHNVKCIRRVSADMKVV
jgi:AraC-like DNA-binding protein